MVNLVLTSHQLVSALAPNFAVLAAGQVPARCAWPAVGGHPAPIATRLVDRRARHDVDLHRTEDLALVVISHSRLP